MDNVDASPEKIDFFVYNIMEWGKKNKRHFVWRERNDEFFVVFISEFFLRKTKSETVDSFLRNVFLKKYRTFCDIAHENVENLKGFLRPLGLHNQRGIALKEIATVLCKKGELPSYEEILELPHCGRYIANAVECFFRKRKRAIVDHNIERVFNRFFSVPKAVEIHKAEYLWNFADKILPSEDFMSYNYYLLDFSALVCRPRKPQCVSCPLSEKCDFYLKKQSPGR
ncbi:MAG: hypothetical protein L5655_10610 [Thermosediminibacteraceae bacterium]|nr:hypothetical protein [Thermosediminibacteraceae bacterium]